MRRLFMTTLGLSFLGALAIGAVYAWESTNTIDGSAPVGGAVHTVRLAPYTWGAGLPVILGPNGHEVKALFGSIDNKGTYPLLIASGAVAFNTVTPLQINGTADTSPGLLCKIDHFAGRVDVTNPGPVGLGVEQGGAFDVYVKVDGEAPDDCQWDIVSMTVSITASTAEAPAP